MEGQAEQETYQQAHQSSAGHVGRIVNAQIDAAIGDYGNPDEDQQGKMAYFAV